MKYNNFWKLMGVSLICITVFGVSNANAKTTTMFTFTVDKPVNGQDACAPKIETEHGTGEYEECIRIKTTQQIMGANGCVTDTTVTTNPTYSGWICSGNDGQTGNSCSVDRVEDTATGKNIVMKCGNTETNVPVNNGTNGTACSVKSSTRNGKAVTTKFDCGGVETEVVTNDGNDGQAGNSCSVARVDDTSTGKNIVMKCGNTETNVPVNNGTDGKVCNTTVSRNASTGKTLITASCEGQTPQTAEIDEDTIATNTVNKIKNDNTVALKEDISGFQTASDVNTLISTETTKEKLKQKLDGEYLSEVPNTVALKEDISGFQTASDVNTLISTATTKEKLKQKLDGEYLTGIPNTVAMKDDLNGYVTTSGSGNNSIGKVLESNNVITTSNIGNNIPGTVAMKTDLNSYATTQALSNATSAATLGESLKDTFVKPSALNGYATTSQLSGMVTTTSLKADIESSGALDGYVTQQNIGTAVDNAISENTNILQGGKNGQTLDQVIAEKVAAALTTAAASCSDNGAETVTCTSQVAQAFQTLAGRSGVTTNKNTSD